MSFETRIYITDDLTQCNVSDEDFITHCEEKGDVYSLQGFQDAWNKNQIKYNVLHTLMRIITIATKCNSINCSQI